MTDPNTCPNCGAQGSLREIGTVVTMQPIHMEFDDDDELTVVDYEAWDWDGDAGTTTGFDCSSCLYEWSDLAALRDAMRASVESEA